MKINEILVEAPTNQRVAGGVPPAANNLKANQARTAAFNQSKLAAQQAGTAQPTTAQAQPTTAQAQPTTAQSQPTTAQSQPTTAQSQPTTAQAQPTTAGKTGGILGAVAKGIGKGVVDAVAPGAVNQIKGATYAYNNRVKSSGEEDGHFDHGQWIKGAQPATAQPATAQPATAQPATVQAATAQPATVQATGGTGKIFSDPAAFKTEWDKYVESKSATAPYQLIADPAMLAVLKDMWMRTGGTNLKESKKNTRKAA